MTMPNVVRHYLRWFELERRKQTFSPQNAANWFRRWRKRSSLRSVLHGLPPTSFPPPPESARAIVEEQERAAGD
jgi:hypothetical protein